MIFFHIYLYFKKKLGLIFFITTIFSAIFVKAQCYRAVPACGYSVSIDYTILSIVPRFGAPPCPWGYNYDVTFSYTANVIGINTCYDQPIEFQTFIYCNGTQSNQSSSIFIPGPPFPTAAPVNITYVGTQTTASTPYNSATDCATATPISLGCYPHHINFAGPGVGWEVYTCNIILPIELLSFDAKCQTENKEVFLSWSTASQLNNNYFTIERSVDGVTFEIVEVIKGAGTNTEILAYTYIDKKPLHGLAYYRLKQTDFNGGYKYSSIVYVECEEKMLEMKVIPNPSSGTFSVFGLEPNSDLVITNMLGELVFETKIKDIETKIKIVESGVYFVKCTSSGKSLQQKIIVE